MAGVYAPASFLYSVDLVMINLVKRTPFPLPRRSLLGVNPKYNMAYSSSADAWIETLSHLPHPLIGVNPF